jgi:ABC-type transporter MlaC component
MAVLRGYAQCETCGENYILRAGVGTERYQPHTFDCKSCRLPISVIVRTNPPNAHFESEENVIIEDSEGDCAVVLNLHPFFAFSSEEIHDLMAFPSLLYGSKIAPYLRLVPNRNVLGIQSQDIALQFDVPNASNLWTTVKNIFLLQEGTGQTKRIKKAIEHYEKQRRKYFAETKVSSSKDVAFNFFDSLFYPRLEELLEPALALIHEIKSNHPQEFTEFLKFYSDSLREEHLRQYISVFSDYFKIYNQLSQMVIHSRIGDEDVDSKIVGSKSFENVKLYYGQAYESLTGFFVVFACLNNILLGRSYDQFQSMTLNKYMKDVSKEKKANPFEQTQPFYGFTDGLDSTLRNGSHHASIWRNGEKIFYRSGGTGAQREIQYSRYLHLCNKLTISLAALFIIELELREATV